MIRRRTTADAAQGTTPDTKGGGKEKRQLIGLYSGVFTELELELELRE